MTVSGVDKRTGLTASAAIAALAVVVATAQRAPAANFLPSPDGRTYKVSVTVRPLPQPYDSGSNATSTSHGYVEYRLQIINRDTRSHRVQIRVPGNVGGYGGDSLIGVSQTVDIAPGPAKIVSILTPGVPLAGNNVFVRVDNDGQVVPCDNAYHMEFSGERAAAVLLSKGVGQSLRNIAAATNIAASSGRGIAVFRDLEPVATWSENPLAYSRFDGLIVTASEMDALPPGVFAAITRYLECGGSLTVVGRWKPPASWQGDRRYETLSYIGFGQCLVGSEDYLLRNQGLLEAMWRGSFAPWQHPHNISNANDLFPVMDDLQVPVKGLFVLMVLFAVAIGPVNLIWLALKKRRIWMLWTVPAASIVTCLAVFLYATFAEGWSGHRRTETLTLLDQRAQHATTLGWTAFYSPLTPTEGLHFALETEVSPQIFDDYYGYYGYRYSSDKGTARTVRYGTDQHLDSGWARARVPAHFMLRKSDTGQAGQKRLIVTESGDAVTVVNALGADLRELTVADGSGMLHRGSNIAGGEKVTLTAMNRQASGSADTLRQFYASDWVGPVSEADLWSTPPRAGPGIVSKLRANVSKCLVPGSYLALMESTPFVSEGLSGAKQRLCRAAVYGRFDTAAPQGRE